MCAEGKKGPGANQSGTNSLSEFQSFSVHPNGGVLEAVIAPSLSLSLSPLLLGKPPQSVRMLSLHSVAGNKKSTYDSAQQNLESTGEKEAEWVETRPEVQVNVKVQLQNSAV